PPVDLSVSGQKVSSPIVTFTALKPGSSPDYKISLDSDKTEAYVGEPIHMRVTWLLGKAAQMPTLSGPDGGDTYDVLALEPPGGIPSNPQQQDNRYAVIHFLEGQAALTRSQGTLDGRAVTAFTLDLVITPKGPGDIEVGPYTMVFDAVIGQRERSIFDFPLD